MKPFLGTDDQTRDIHSEGKSFKTAPSLVVDFSLLLTSDPPTAFALAAVGFGPLRSANFIFLYPFSRADGCCLGARPTFSSDLGQMS